MEKLMLAYIFWAMSYIVTQQRAGTTGTITGLIIAWRVTILQNIDTWLYSATNNAINTSVKILQLQDNWNDFYPHTSSNAITLTGSTTQQIWPASGSMNWVRISQIAFCAPPGASLVLVESTGTTQQRTTIINLSSSGYHQSWVERFGGPSPVPAYYVNGRLTGDFQLASQSPYTQFWLEVNGAGLTGHTAEVSIVFWTDSP